MTRLINDEVDASRDYYGPQIEECPATTEFRYVNRAMSAEYPATAMMQLVWDGKMGYSDASWWWKHYRGADANLQNDCEREEQ